MKIEITGSVSGNAYCWTFFGLNGQLVCMGVNNHTGNNDFASKASALNSAYRFVDNYLHATLRVRITDWNGKELGGQNTY